MALHGRVWILLVAAAACATVATAQDSAQKNRRRTPVVEVFEETHDAVVNISTTHVVRVRSLHSGSVFDDIFDFGYPTVRSQRVQSVGSGVVIHPNGYIVTNGHVVAQASDIRVGFADKRNLPAEIVAVDSEHDLAVLKVKPTEPLRCVKLGRGDDIMVGETVVAIGNPLGLQNTVTTGIVSALNRTLHFGRDTDYHGLIQTDAAINPGNSGGPLLNVNGELIGINTAMRGDAENVGFAISVGRLWELLPEMLDIERHERVRFGLSVNGLDGKVVGVRSDSPAAKAGLRVGDRVLTLDGASLTNGIDYYVQMLSEKPDSAVQLVVQRGDKRVKASVPLESIPPPDGRKLAEQLLGLKLAEIPSKVRREAELPDDIGLIVEDVTRRGPADRGGIQAGDLIRRINRVTVPTLANAGLVLEGIEPQQWVSVEGWRLRPEAFPWTTQVRAQPPR